MILAVLQARVSSSRLPGKVLRPILGRPMLARQVERVLRAERLDELVSYVDILPTLRGITQPSAEASPSDGLDLFELLKGGEPASDRTVYLGEGSVVTRSWKQVGDQLFRIDTDPGEHHDVAAERPEIVEQLREFERQITAATSR